MSAPSPTVSIVMGVHNGQQSLPETLRSIRAQTFEDYEVVAVDDGSTDGTGETLCEAARGDKRFRVVTLEANQGLTRALMRGCAEARGRFIARIDSGDWMAPQRLERQVEFLEEHPGVGLLGSALVVHYDVDGYVFEKTAALPESDEAIRRYLRFRNPFNHVSVLFHRDAYEKAGGYDPSLYYSQDYDLWSRLLCVTRGANLPEPLTHCAFSGDSISIQHNTGQLLCVARIQWRNIHRHLAPWYTAPWILRLLAFAAIPCKLRSRLRFRMHGARLTRKAPPQA